MSRLPSSETAEVEEHLLVCLRCQNDWQASERTIGYIRHAALAWENKRAAKISPWRRRMWEMPKPVFVLAAAGICLLLAIAVARRGYAPPPITAVVLQSARGAGAATDPKVQSGNPFLLSLDLTGLETAEQYGVEIVTSTGKVALYTSAVPGKGRATVTVGQGLRPGSYFIRLYTPRQELVREYHLTALR
jgi:hypothetical protein